MQSNRQNKQKIVDIDPTLKVTNQKFKKCDVSVKDGLAQISKAKNIEACSDDAKIIKLPAQHGLLSVIQIAHSYHYPLQLAPDDLWTMIMQGFCEHMRINHEKLRSKFVNFDGQKTLTVFRNDFVKGSATNDWPSVFSSFSKQIGENIGKENFNSLMPQFTSTTPLRKIVSELSMVNAMQHFFSYRCSTDCGISKVKLEGTLADWQKLKLHIQKLDDYELEWWTPGLLEIVDKIIGTFKGTNIDPQFWKFIFKYYTGCGSGVNPSIDGWIINFIPYIDNKPSPFAQRSLAQTMKEYIEGDKEDNQEMIGDEDWFMDVDLSQPGLDIEKFKKTASGISITPFVFQSGGVESKMNFISGFAGATMTQDGFIKPQLGWAVAEQQENEKKKPRTSTKSEAQKLIIDRGTDKCKGPFKNEEIIDMFNKLDLCKNISDNSSRFPLRRTDSRCNFSFKDFHSSCKKKKPGLKKTLSVISQMLKGAIFNQFIKHNNKMQ